MAEAILFNLTADIIFKLGSSALRQFGSLRGGVKDDFDKLWHSLSAIQAVLHDAEEKQFKDHAVEVWVSRLKDVLYEIDDLIDEFSYQILRRQVLQSNRKQVRTLFSKFITNWKIGHKIKEISQRLQNINEDKIQFSFCKHVIERRDDDDEGLRKRRETHSFILEDEVIGRNDDKEAVIDLLLNSNTKEDIAIVSIVGMPGFGKTALAQFIYNHKRIMTQFQLKIWVCVSDEFDLKITIQKIIESATGKKPKSLLQMDPLQCELRKQIDGKKYLIVMDDVWNEKKEKWLHLKRLLMGGAKGSRILITTRSEQVAKTFDSTFVHLLQILDASNSWLLFQKMIGLEEHSNNQEIELDQKNSNLIQIGMEIVSTLRGVPLLIRTIGGLLKDNKSERFWLSFKNKELYQVLGRGQDALKEIQLFLELSYKYLPSSNLKQCFLYCALFPKDYRIKKDELILLWRAQGFIQQNGNNDDNSSLVDIGEDYFMELLSRSFFQEVEKNDFGDIITCKMHDLMHDLACSITNNECVRGLKGNVIDKRTHHLSFEKVSHEDQLMGSLSKATHLRTLFSQDVHSRCNLEETFHNIFQLRTLHLNSYGPPKCAKTLEFISKLKHLRYLHLRNSFRVTYLPDLKLYNLETFIFQSSLLKKLPSNVGNLINLKHLDLSSHLNLEFLPDSITKLYKLEALILDGCSNLKELPKYTKRLINLKRLVLYGCSALTHMPKGLSEMTNLQTLTTFVLGKNIGGELKELEGLTKLRGGLSIKHLESCTSIVDQQMKSKLLQLKSGLQKLELQWKKPKIGDDQLEDVMYESVLDCLQPHSNLKEIRIDGYGGVNLCNWVSSNKSLGCLVTIYLYRCKRLRHLFRLDQFPNLKYLTLQNLPNIEYMIVDNDDSVSSSTIFPCLKKFTISKMPKLVSWCKDSTSTKSPTVIFPHLSSLMIRGPCRLHMLKYWHAPKLKLLQISDSEDELNVVPLKIYENLTSLFLHNLSRVEYLPECWQHYMTSLQLLYLSKCENLKSLPGWIGNLTSLTGLKISTCDKLTMLPEEIDNLTSLTNLDISYCKNLAFLPEGIQHIHNLRSIAVIGCPILEEWCKKNRREDWPKIKYYISEHSHLIKN